MSAQNSLYSVTTTTADPATGELTNIGLVVFDGDGRYHSHRVADLRRAIRRGDWPEAEDGDYLDDFARELTSIGVVRRRRDSMAQSRVQLTGPAGSRLPPDRLMAELFLKLIKE